MPTQEQLDAVKRLSIDLFSELDEIKTELSETIVELSSVTIELAETKAEFRRAKILIRQLAVRPSPILQTTI